MMEKQTVPFVATLNLCAAAVAAPTLAQVGPQIRAAGWRGRAEGGERMTSSNGWP